MGAGTIVRSKAFLTERGADTEASRSGRRRTLKGSGLSEYVMGGHEIPK